VSSLFSGEELHVLRAALKTYQGAASLADKHSPNASLARRAAIAGNLLEWVVGQQEQLERLEAAERERAWGSRVGHR
jgi:hypothetical protein